MKIRMFRMSDDGGTGLANKPATKTEKKVITPGEETTTPLYPKIPRVADQEKKGKVKNKKAIKVVCAILAATTVVGGGLAVTYNIALNNNVFNPELNNPIYQEFESSEFEKALDSFKHGQVDINDANAVQRYLSELNTEMLKSFETKNRDIIIQPTSTIDKVALKGNELQINIRGFAMPVVNYTLTTEQLADLYMLMQSDDPNVQIKIGAFINEIIKANEIKEMQNFRYSLTEFGTLFRRFSKFINEKGYNVSTENFYVKKIDNYEASEGKFYMGDIVFGYNDGKVVSEFKCSNINLRYNNGSVGLGSLLHYDDSYFAELANQFDQNAKSYISLNDYLKDASTYVNGAVVNP